VLEARLLTPERPGRPARHAYRLTGEGRRLAQQAPPAHRLGGGDVRRLARSLVSCVIGFLPPERRTEVSGRG
jgi:hypothetical protein